MINGRVDITEILNGPAESGSPLKVPTLPSILNVSVESDAVLLMAESPFQVPGELVVDKGATLYAQPGVKLLYGKQSSIVIRDGGMIARGTREQPITFTASGASVL